MNELELEKEISLLSEKDQYLIKSRVCLPHFIPERLRLFFLFPNNVETTSEVVLCKNMLLQINNRYRNLDDIKKISSKSYLHPYFRQYQLSLNQRQYNSIMIPYATMDNAIIIVPEVIIDNPQTFVYEDSLYSPYLKHRHVSAEHKVYCSSILGDNIEFKDLNVIDNDSNCSHFEMFCTYPNSVISQK